MGSTPGVSAHLQGPACAIFPHSVHPLCARAGRDHSPFQRDDPLVRADDVVQPALPSGSDDDRLLVPRILQRDGAGGGLHRTRLHVHLHILAPFPPQYRLRVQAAGPAAVLALVAHIQRRVFVPIAVRYRLQLPHVRERAPGEQHSLQRPDVQHGANSRVRHLVRRVHPADHAARGAAHAVRRLRADCQTARRGDGGLTIARQRPLLPLRPRPRRPPVGGAAAHRQAHHYQRAEAVAGRGGAGCTPRTPGGPDYAHWYDQHY
mmetsp:Transcript_5898/g.13009  ORF Transcript_5898/g.13009 Transcript_5898/m.13009 type:complete len:262 (-) Transcript_5898:663-1448(-)